MTIPTGVAAGHPATARAGADLLARGGSAADAAVGMLLVSCAAEALFTGLSGGGFATYYDASSRQTFCVDFFVHVPGLGGRTRGPGVPIEVWFVGQRVHYERGAATVAVPGVPAGAAHLWRRWGRLDWREVVQPGLEASYGTPFPAAHAALLPAVAEAMCVGEGERVFRRPDGDFLQAGDPLSHEDHHRAFELLADDPDGLYHGDYAKAMVAALDDGGALELVDLESYSVVEAPPRVVTLRGAQVAARGDDLDDILGTLDRSNAVSGDPLYEPEPALALVDALRGTDRRAETTNCVAVDAEGNTCVVTSTMGLGSAIYVPGYGVHLNSMLGEGELIRGDLTPGVRMGSMMSPMIISAGGEPVIATGAAGGSRIRPALVQCILRMLAGESAQQAIDAPRLNALAGMVRLEPGFSPAVIKALEQAGNAVAVAAERAPYFGGVSALSVLGGGADPRRGGTVILL